MPEVERSVPVAAVVYQPFKTNLAGLRASVAAEERRTSWAPTRWYETDREDAGVGAARRAIADGADVVLASGGDGTIRAVAEALRGSGVPMAVIPQGTGNLLARNLGMPLGDIATAVRAAFRGKNRAIDLGVLRILRENEEETEHVFLVLAGMGLDARAISATSAQLKKAIGWLAYIDGGVRTMVRDKPLRIHYTFDGSEPKWSTVYTVMIGNCGLMPGGVLLIPDAELDDGRLDVIALRPLGRFSWLKIWRRLGWENGVLRKTRLARKFIDLQHDARNIIHLQAQQYTLSVDRPEPIQLDGDDFGYALAASGRVDPGSLVVRVLPGWKRRD